MTIHDPLSRHQLAAAISSYCARNAVFFSFPWGTGVSVSDCSQGDSVQIVSSLVHSNYLPVEPVDLSKRTLTDGRNSAPVEN